MNPYKDLPLTEAYYSLLAMFPFQDFLVFSKELCRGLLRISEHFPVPARGQKENASLIPQPLALGTTSVYYPLQGPFLKLW